MACHFKAHSSPGADTLNTNVPEHVLVEAQPSRFESSSFLER